MRLSVAMAVAWALISSLSAAEPTQAAVRQSTNIPAQGLGSALQTLAKQRAFQVIYLSDAVDAQETQGASGELTLDEALKQLLGGTGLAYRYLDESTVTVFPANLPQSKNGSSGAQSGRAVRLMLAQADPAEKSGNTENTDSNNKKDSAVSADASSNTLEEIVVTAQKREERLIDVPISIIAITADELQKRRINSVDDLSSAVPGLVTISGGMQRRILIRGVSNLFGSSPLVGIYLDEAPLTPKKPDANVDVQTFDLERVEVLRGPQGTLFGDGSIGGVVRFVTNKPQLDRFSMTADVAAMFTEDGEPGQRVETAVNVPLIEDQLGLRIAGNYVNEGGWVDQPAQSLHDVNSHKGFNVRTQLRWQPAPNFTVDALALIQDKEIGAGQGEDTDGNRASVFDLAVTPKIKHRYEIYNLTMSYDFGAIQALSTSTYSDTKVTSLNFGQVAQVIGAPPEPALQVFDPYFLVESNIFSQELRLVSTGTGPWQWSLGGLYRDVQNDPDYYVAGTYVALSGEPLPPAPGGSALGTLASESWAFFGDVSVKLTDRLTIGTGARYFEEKQEEASSFDGSPMLSQAAKFDSVSPRLYAKYALAKNANVYASVSEGFRSGGFNGRGQPQYDPDDLRTYEAGAKASLLGGRLDTAVATFYTDWRDYQLVGLIFDENGIPLNVTSNAGDVTIKGVEGELSWRPFDRWTVGLNATYMESEFVEIRAEESPVIVGDSLPLFPEFSYSASLDHDFVWLGRSGFARVDYSSRDRIAYRLRNIGPYFSGQSGIINMLNLNAGIQWSDQLALGVFAQNLLNDRDLVDPYSLEGIAQRSRPRTWGVRFGVTF